MTRPLTLLIADPADGVWFDYSDVVEWSAEIEKTLGQPWTMRVTIQDRENATPGPPPRAWVKAIINTTTVYQGEAVITDLALPVGFPWRRWVLECTDWNTAFDLRLMVTDPGDMMWDGPDSSGVYTRTRIPYNDPPYDPGVPLLQFVQDHVVIPAGSITAGELTHAPRITDRMIYDAGDTTVRGFLDGLDNTGDPNTYWLDGQLRLNWNDAPSRTVRTTGRAGDADALALMMPATRPIPSTYWAPIDTLADDPGNPAYTYGAIGCRELRVRLDGMFMPEAVFIRGAADATQHVAPYGVDSTPSGNGWWAPNGHGPEKRQYFVDASGEGFLAKYYVGPYYLERGEAPIVHGSCKIHGVDGWDVGQYVRIVDARLPDYLNSRYWQIQRLRVSLIPANDIRIYEIEWGDKPIGRFSSKRKQLAKEPDDVKTKVEPGVQRHVIDVKDTILAPGNSTELTFQLADGAAVPIRKAGIPVDFVVLCTDITSGDFIVDAGGATVDPEQAITNDQGQVTTTLTAGDLTGVRYQVDALVEDTALL